MDDIDENQNFTNRKREIAKNFSSILTQHEELRRATLLKHRKVSTQLKLDMIQRQLSTLHRSNDSDRQFYHLQMAELSNELHDLGSNLDQAEKHAFYSKKRLMRHCGISLDNSRNLSTSNPSLWTSAEDLRGSRSSLKARVRHLVSASPTGKLKKINFFGELRAAASLSSLNMKSGSPTSDDSNSDAASPKDTSSKSWKKFPFRFLGHLVDSRFRRSFWRKSKSTSSAQMTKSAGNILEENKDDKDKDDCFEGDEDVFNSTSSSSEEEVEEEEFQPVKVTPRYAVRGPVVRKISSHQKAQVDPAVLAEIEDFEKMAENYIKQHS
ncbi:hypothetical protein JTE90_022328 [Oedothorax gibbosus]|uniref:Uncharacterized protein n=1 Tax=Oedothorax gibbosus TaxID=931172 RepID=A0AAV6VY99_9ARAC|nr:hypothetical protein JTE90_022328 [Oedothorax gibbosus]